MITFPDLPGIPGISLLERGEDSIKLAVGPEAEAPQFLRLLLWLPRRFELSFFDQYFPSPTDPGGFVDIQRKEQWFRYRMGNHGWSTGWQYQSPQLLAALMALNRVPIASCPEPLERIRVRKAAHDPEGWED